jgi:carbonic anhydrase/acetyltransferase-like protein (isoleucine patch superfamily)
MNIDQSVYVAKGAVLSGDNITVGKDSSIWCNSVLRCSHDQRITVGQRTNIQDLSMIHVDPGYDVTIGDGVTVGHMCLLHGCTIGNNSLIGMGSIIMNGAVIGNNCVIGAGSLITAGKIIPDGTMAFGRPAKVIKELSEEEINNITKSADHYVKEANEQRV